MSVKASIKHLRVSPRKARLLADMIRGKSVQKALDALRFTKKKTSIDFIKLVKQAVANAGQKASVDTDQLIVGKVFVNQGPVMKRFMPRAKGSASPILKRFSHIYLELIER